MKKISLIGVSAVTAALLVSGCGSSSSSSGSGAVAGDDVIKSIQEPIIIDENTTKITLGLLEEEFLNFGGGIPRKVAKLKANFKAMVEEANFALEGPEDCSVSGTREYTNRVIADEEYLYSEEDSWTYDNCVDSGSYGTVDGVPLNLSTQNGTQTYTYSYGYDVDSNTSRDSYSGADNYTQTYENNETAVVSRTYTYQSTSEYKTESTGEEPYWNIDPETAGEGAFVRRTWMEDGTRMSEDINASGETVSSWKDVAENFSAEEYELVDGSAGSRTINGGMVYYQDGVSNGGSYFDNYTVEWTRMNNEKTMNINGTAGSTCLDGSVSVQTTAIMKENQVDYFDGEGSDGSDVLPYTGSVTLTGADSTTANVVFDTNDINETSATVTIGSDANQTYYYWSALADDSCSIQFFD